MGARVVLLWSVSFDDHVWTDGVVDVHHLADVTVVGVGAYLPTFPSATQVPSGSHPGLGEGGIISMPGVVPSVRGPWQTVRRAELWEAVLTLKVFWPGHLGADV